MYINGASSLSEDHIQAAALTVSNYQYNKIDKENTH